jgi:hypothetical protein
VRELIEKSAPAGSPAPRVKIRADVGTASGEKTSLVWGVIPAMTDEKIIINAHRDGYYEAANNNATGVARAPAHKDEFYPKAALLINGEHTAPARTDLFGNRLMAPDISWEANIFAGGGPELEPLVQKDPALPGVSHYKELDASPAGDTGSTCRLAPSLQLIVATHFYHTGHDTYETIPPNGPENVTRACARIIDDVNKLDFEGCCMASAERGQVEQPGQMRCD